MLRAGRVQPCSTSRLAVQPFQGRAGVTRCWRQLMRGWAELWKMHCARKPRGCSEPGAEAGVAMTEKPRRLSVRPRAHSAACGWSRWPGSSRRTSFHQLPGSCYLGNVPACPGRGHPYAPGAVSPTSSQGQPGHVLFAFPSWRPGPFPLHVRARPLRPRPCKVLRTSSWLSGLWPRMQHGPCRWDPCTLPFSLCVPLPRVDGSLLLGLPCFSQGEGAGAPVGTRAGGCILLGSPVTA